MPFFCTEKMSAALITGMSSRRNILTDAFYFGQRECVNQFQVVVSWICPATAGLSSSIVRLKQVGFMKANNAETPDSSNFADIFSGKKIYQ